MAAIRRTTGTLHDGPPTCPHCGDSAIFSAALTLEDLVREWPVPHFVPVVDMDGYLTADRARSVLTVDCPACGRPSAVCLSAERVTLIAARTERDWRLSHGKY